MAATRTSSFRFGRGLLALVLVAALVVATPSVSPAQEVRELGADITFVIDDSSSMRGDAGYVKSRVSEMVQDLTDAGIDPRFGLVEFAGTETIRSPLTDDLDAFGAALSLLSGNNGNPEAGFSGVVEAMSEKMGFREEAGVCVVLISDEDADVRTHSRQDALDAMAVRDATFFGIVALGAGSTERDYGPDAGSLSAETGGGVFSLGQFRDDPAAILDAVTNACAQRVVEQRDTDAGPDQVVPEGGDVVLAGTVPVTRTGPVGQAWEEQLDLDSYESSSDGAAGPVATTTPLAAGVVHEVVVSGNFNAWGRGLCGAPDAVLYPSPNDRGLQAGVDAEFQYGRPSGCTGLPYHNDGFEIDTGSGFSHLEPVDGVPAEVASDHTYTYRVVGEGQPLSARHLDSPLTDNSGMFRVTVRPAEDVVPWDFQWETVSSQGPPIQLLGAETLTPTFETIDDGVYRFRLTATNGDDVSRDEITVRVENVAPQLGVEAAPTTDDGLVMVSASITDVGFLDTHRIDVEWGDGSSSTGVPAGARGAGWASLAAGHVYDAAGDYDVDVTIVDDDGGRTTSETTISVGGAGVPTPEAGVAMWADDPSGPGITMAGNDTATIGLVHSNSSLRLNGTGQVLLGGTEYVTDLRDVDGPAEIDPAPTRVEVTQPPPTTFDLDEYAPGGEAAAAAGEAWFDQSSSCGSTWRPKGALEPGLYWVPCDVDITGSAVAAGPVTIVSTGRIKVAGRDRDLQAAFVDTLALATSSTAVDAIVVNGSSTAIGGHVYAPNGGVKVAGQGHDVTCGVVAAHITVDGGDHRFDAGACGSKDDAGSLSDGTDVAAPPLLVPDLGGDTVASPSALGPAGATDVTVEVHNDGASLVVTGLTALSNRSGSAVSVDDAIYELEVYDLAADQWLPLTDTRTAGSRLVGHPVVTGGVDLPEDGSVAGTVIDDDAAAAWAVTATVELSAEQVERILDPASTVAVRNRLVLDTSTDLRVRQTTRFGGNVVEALREAGGDITDTAVRLSSPSGVQASHALGTLAPGQSLTWAEASLAAPELPAAPNDDQSDAAYLAALRALDRTTLVGLVRANGDSSVGAVGASLPPVDVAVDLPVVTIEAEPLAAADPGSSATWQLTLENVGSTPAEGLVVDIDSGAVPSTTGEVPTTLDPGERRVVEVALDVPTDLGDTVILRAEAAWADAAGASYGPLGTNASLRILLPSKLDVDKWVDRDVSVPFGQVPYVVMVRNTGDAELSGVVAVDDLEPGLRLVDGSVDVTAGSLADTGDDGLLQFDIGTIAPRAEVFLRYVVDATGLAVGDQRVVNQAEVTANGLPPTVSDDPTRTGEGQPTIHVFASPPNPGEGGTSGGGGGTGGSTDGPTVGPVFPTDGLTVTEPIDVRTTLTPRPGRAIESWRITARRAGTAAAVAQEIASSAAAGAAQAALADGDATASAAAVDEVVDVVAEFDPTTRDNGIWVLRLVATDDTGARTVRESSVVVDGDFKPGRVVSTYLDAEVGAGAFPLQVRRTYDSLRRDIVDDFGHGWDLEVAGPRVQTNTALGLGPWSAETCGIGLIFADLCWSNDQQRYVTVTWPDGRAETFDFTPTGNSFFQIGIQATYTARPGTTSTLAPVGADGTAGLNTGDGHIHDGGFGEGPVYAPTQFLLTDQFGTEYLLEVGRGLRRIRDRSGNTLTVDDDGITSSFGPSLAFIRDRQGRVREIDGPGDLDLSYSYDAAGDLVEVVNPNGDPASWDYVDHRIVAEYGGAATAPLSSFSYDAAGRLSSIVDADGVETLIEPNISERQEIVTANDGRLTTVSHYDDVGNRVLLEETFDGVTHRTEFDHDEHGNVTSRKDPADNVWNARWDGLTITSFEAPGRPGLDISYDDRGLPRIWTDQAGNPTEYRWNDNGTLREIVDADGESETYTYYPDGNRETRTDREGNTSGWTYDEAGLVASETDANGHTTDFEYDNSGRLTRRVDPLVDGETARGETTWIYDAVGNVTSRSDPNGNTTTWVYDDLNRLVRREDPSPAGETYATTWTYTNAGRVETETDPEGVATHWTYGRNGQVETMRVGDLAPTRYAYDGAGRLTSETDPVGRTTAYTYDLAGRVKTVTNPADGTTTHAYWPDGKIRTVTDPVGATTTTTYTPRGMVDTVTDTITDTLERTTDYDYDLVGRLDEVVFDDGTTQSHDYDRAGRLTSTTGSATGTTTFGYDDNGNRTSVTDATQVTTTSDYDALDRLTATRDAYDNTTSYEYDLGGRMESSTTPEGVTTTYDYDARGLQAARSDDLGNTWRTFHDAAGRVQREVDARGAETLYGYDPAGRLASVTDDAGNDVTFGYDDAGQRISLTDPRDKTWTYDHALTGGIARETDPLGNDQEWSYDRAGRLESHLDGRDIRQTYELDLAGQRRATVHPEGRVEFGYDTMGRRTRMVDESGTTTWGYDPDGQLARVAAPAGTVDYSYDAAGRRETMTTPDGTVTYGYDDAGRMDSVTDWNQGTVDITLDGDGRWTGLTHPNGTSSSWDFDAAGRLVDVTHRNPDDQVIESFAYTHDPNGNRRTMTSSAGTETYTLNRLGQLETVDYPDRPDVTWTYDPAGNRTTESVTGQPTTTSVYDDASRLTSVGGVDFTHDAAGNLVSAGDDSFDFDWDGRVVEATVDGTTATYGYDADGLRVDADGTALTYDRTADGLVPALLGDGDTTWLTAVGRQVSQVDATGAGRSLVDALGSVRAVTDTSGTVTRTSTYDSFGGQVGDVGRIGYTGGQQDPSGQVWLHARTYDPGLGRFLSVDPVRPGAGGVVGYNPYTYVANNPTTSTDPTGMMAAVSYRQVLLVAGAAAASAAHWNCVQTGCYQGLGGAVGDAFRRMVDLLVAGGAAAAAPVLDRVRVEEDETEVEDPPVPDPDPELNPDDVPPFVPVVSDVDLCKIAHEALKYTPDAQMELEATAISRSRRAPWFNQTVASLLVCHQPLAQIETISGGQPDLDDSQRFAAMNLGHTVARSNDARHAEPTVIQRAGSAVKIKLYSTNLVCDACKDGAIEDGEVKVKRWVVFPYP